MSSRVASAGARGGAEGDLLNVGGDARLVHEHVAGERGSEAGAAQAEGAERECVVVAGAVGDQLLGRGARPGAHGRRRGLGLAAQMRHVGALAAAVAGGDAHQQQRVAPCGEQRLVAGRVRVVVRFVDHELVAAHGEDIDPGLRLGAADDDRGLFQIVRRVQFEARFVLAELQRRQTAEAQLVESGGGRFRRCRAAAQDHPVDTRRLARERLQLEFDRGLAGGRQRDLMAGLLRVGVGRADRELGSGVVGGGLDRDLFETGLGREQLGVRVEGGTECRSRQSCRAASLGGPAIVAVTRPRSMRPSAAQTAPESAQSAGDGKLTVSGPSPDRLQGDQPVLGPAALIDGQH